MVFFGSKKNVNFWGVKNNLVLVNDESTLWTHNQSTVLYGDKKYSDASFFVVTKDNILE